MSGADSSRIAAARAAATGRTAGGGTTIPTGDTTAPSAPGSVVATAGVSQVTLTWAYVSESDPATSVNIYRSLTTGANFSLLIGAQAGTSYVDTTVTASTQYFYYVTGLDITGNESVASSEVNATPTVASPDSITIDLTDITVLPTYNTIGVTIPYTLDTNNSASVVMVFDTDAAFSNPRTTLPMTRAVGASAKYWLGDCLDLAAGTQYHIKVTFTDSGGVVVTGGTNPIVLTATTWADTITAPSALVATHYVDWALGTDDTSHGTSAGAGAWKTYKYAVTRINLDTSGSLIALKLANNYYRNPTAALTRDDVVILSESLAVAVPVTGQSNPSNDDPAPRHGLTPDANGITCATIFDFYVAPTSSTIADDAVDVTNGRIGKGGWTGPDANDVYHIDVGTSKVEQVSYSLVTGGAYSTARAAVPLRVPNWQKDNTSLGTAAGFSNLVKNNLSQTYGHWQDSGVSTELYIRLPAGIDPGTCYIWIGERTGTDGSVTAPGTTLKGDSQRVCGLLFRAHNNGVRLDSTAANTIIDRCVFETHEHGVLVRAGGTGQRPRLATIQYCRFLDDIWSDNTTTTPKTPWRGIKQHIVITAPFTEYGETTVMARTQTNAIKFFKVGSQIVFRYNTVDGPFNGVGSHASNADIAQQGCIDVYGNVFRRIGDDIIEPEGVNTHWRVWNNRMESFRSGVSSDSSYGPLYLWRNLWWQSGVQGITGDGRTSPSDNNDKGGNGHDFKFGTADNPGLKVFVIHNTFWSNQTGTKGGTSAISGANRESFYWRNNIMRSTEHGFEIDANLTGFDEDYNEWAAPTVGIQYHGVEYTAIATYRSASSMGTHDNKFGAAGADAALTDTTSLDALLTDTATGDLRLKSGTNPLVGAGVLVPNINDLTGDRDIGFQERV